MKIFKYIKIIALPLILIAVLVTGFSINNTESTIHGKLSGDELKTENLNPVESVSSYQYKPEGDSRIWRVTNKYGMDSNGKFEINNSEYTFTADSVTVINEIASMPGLEPYVTGLIFKRD